MMRLEFATAFVGRFMPSARPRRWCRNRTAYVHPEGRPNCRSSPGGLRQLAGIAHQQAQGNTFAHSERFFQASADASGGPGKQNHSAQGENCLLCAGLGNRFAPGLGRFRKAVKTQNKEKNKGGMLREKVEGTEKNPSLPKGFILF